MMCKSCTRVMAPRFRSDGAVRGVGLVFHKKTGGPLNRKTLRRDYFYPLPERLNLPRIRLHDRRHLNASLMLQQGVDLATVSARLGHASKAFTLHQYTHMLSAGQEMAAEVGSQLSVRKEASKALAAGSTIAENPLQ